jgi:mono/diheme cytochrome c family protein
MKAFFTWPGEIQHINIAIAIAIVVAFVPDASPVLAQNNDTNEKRLSLADAALADVPEKARMKKNPFDGDASAIAAGGKLFQERCANCHGEKGGGTKAGTSLLREEVQQATPGTLFWIVTNGAVRHGMPVWSKLPEPERWQIVTFLQSLHAHR